jgi:hypothetical protein
MNNLLFFHHPQKFRFCSGKAVRVDNYTADPTGREFRPSVADTGNGLGREIYSDPAHLMAAHFRRRRRSPMARLAAVSMMPDGSGICPAIITRFGSLS